MTTHHDIDDALLGRFFAGDASDADRAEILRWAAADPDRNAELAALRELWEQAGTLPSSRRIEAMWASMQRQMHEPETMESRGAVRAATEATRPLRVMPSARRRVWIRRACVGATHLAFTLILVGLWRAGVGDRDNGVAALESTREVRTSRGEQMRLRLVDGTQVELGPESSMKLRYVVDGPREVELVGEAVFTVTHDVRRPFRVRSGNAVTEDLGTRFGIRAYPGEESVRVVVAEGVVALWARGSSDQTVLRPGQIGRLDRAGWIATEHGVNAAAYLGWTGDRLFYRQVPLREIANDLQRRYDVAIQIPEASVAERRVTLDLPNARLSDVLDAITVPLKIRSERVGQTIVLRS